MDERRSGKPHEPGLLEKLFEPLVEAMAPSVRQAVAEDPFGFDAEFVRSVLPLIKAADAYFNAEIRGWENLPPSGPFLLVGNHSGGALPIDPWPFYVRWFEEHGDQTPLYCLTYDLDFSYPVVGENLRRMGMIPASHENARRAFERGSPVLVFPGGDYEVFRPWTERNRIDFGGRKGFLRLALSTGVPIVPMTIHGAHESTFVITRGRRIARMSGLEKLHIKVFPFVWNIPLGIMPAAIPTVVLPAKVTVQLGEPLAWPEHGPDAASDDEILQRCYDEVTGAMQATLDALDREDPYPVLTRLNELRPGPALARAWRSLWSSGRHEPKTRARGRELPAGGGAGSPSSRRSASDRDEH
jgi:1-acyl-sn-glycerol-3-phosphate acyltransferase